MPLGTGPASDVGRIERATTRPLAGIASVRLPARHVLARPSVPRRHDEAPRFTRPFRSRALPIRQRLAGRLELAQPLQGDVALEGLSDELALLLSPCRTTLSPCCTTALQLWAVMPAIVAWRRSRSAFDSLAVLCFPAFLCRRPRCPELVSVSSRSV